MSHTSDRTPPPYAPVDSCASIDSDMILVPRRDLETEHRQLLSRLHLLRRQLGLPPLPTPKQQRKAEQ